MHTIVASTSAYITGLIFVKYKMSLKVFMHLFSSPYRIGFMHGRGLFKTDMTFCVGQSSFQSESHYVVSLIRTVVIKRITSSAWLVILRRNRSFRILRAKLFRPRATVKARNTLCFPLLFIDHNSITITHYNFLQAHVII